MSDLAVANTIAQQMGGTGRLTAMIGAKNFAGDDNSLSFSFKMSKKTNKVRITLTPMDTYKVEFFKVAKYEAKLVESFDDIYCDMLKSVFEKTTGLYLSL